VRAAGGEGCCVRAAGGEGCCVRAAGGEGTVRVALTGATSPLGVRVRAAAALEAGDGVEPLEVQPFRGGGPLPADLLADCDVLVHLGHEPAGESSLPPSDDAPVEVDGAGTVPEPRDTAALLAAAAEAGIDHVVLLSSAMAYGAWPTNPVPITEDAVLKPNPSLRFAVERAEEERLVAAWRSEHPDATAAVLRPTVQVAEDRWSWLSRSAWDGGGVRPGGAEPPVQFVHLDDVASAVVLAARKHLDGAFNVAPDGWLKAEELQALAGGPRVRLPDAAATRLQALRWRLGLVSSPPGVVPYVAQPWVVANDRLRAEGWVPRWSNEEAFVAADRPGVLATITPKRRQELALGAAGVAIVGAATGAGLAIRRAIRKRRPASSVRRG
jgi:nucleoside-diphosphate-sugar epimerase